MKKNIVWTNICNNVEDIVWTNVYINVSNNVLNIIFNDLKIHNITPKVKQSVLSSLKIGSI